MRNFYQNLLDVFKRSPAVFYTYYDTRYSYAEGYEIIKKFNVLLSRYRKSAVAVYSPKSMNSYCAIYAILLSGNTWVPLSQQQPVARLINMLALSKPALLLVEGALPEEVALFAASNGIRVEDMDQLGASPIEKEVALGDFNEDEPAYIMFTSGSTGTPKGVPMTHRNYINFIHNALEVIPFAKGEVFSDFHEVAFDISIFYLFCAVLTESAIVPFINNEERFMPINSIVRNKITVWSSVPSALSRTMILRPNDKVDTSLKIMFICGEPFRLDLLRYLQDKVGAHYIYNFYGLTETGVENFYHLCSAGDVERFQSQGFVPIGAPLKGNKVMVSEEGELMVSGCQVTPGYLGGVDQGRFRKIGEEIWFLTGDVVQVADNRYFCKGRKDYQVKVGGYRIELMDIEVQLRKCKGVADAVCFVTDQAEKKIVAVLESGLFDFGEFRAGLTAALPPYMIPKEFYFVAQFPKNNSGKTDRVKLASLHAEGQLRKLS